MIKQTEWNFLFAEFHGVVVDVFELEFLAENGIDLDQI